MWQNGAGNTIDWGCLLFWMTSACQALKLTIEIHHDNYIFYYQQVMGA